MDDKLGQRLRRSEASYEETLGELADPEVLGNQARYREVSTRHAELKPIVDAYRKYVEAEAEASDAAELAAVEDDPEMVAYLKAVVATRQAEPVEIGRASWWESV